MDKNVHETTSPWKKLGMVALSCHYRDGRKPKIGGLWSRQPGQNNQDPSSKITRIKSSRTLAFASTKS
jgi:hypothetical protein